MRLRAVMALGQYPQHLDLWVLNMKLLQDIHQVIHQGATCNSPGEEDLFLDALRAFRRSTHTRLGTWVTRLVLVNRVQIYCKIQYFTGT